MLFPNCPEAVGGEMTMGSSVPKPLSTIKSVLERIANPLLSCPKIQLVYVYNTFSPLMIEVH